MREGIERCPAEFLQTEQVQDAAYKRLNTCDLLTVAGLTVVLTSVFWWAVQ